VVEGWYGQPFAKPLQRTREYVGIIRQILARQAPVTNDGPQYPLPYTGPGSTGLGKPLKPIVHPLRADLPIWLGAEGPKNVALTAEIADGWLAIYYAPRLAGMYNDWLDEGFARAGARRSRENFEIAASCQVVLTEDAKSEIERMRWIMALYIGGMGAPELNFHAQVYRRMGYEREVDEIGRLFQEGKKAEAAALVPDELILDTAIIGDEEHVRKQLGVWAAAGVTEMLVSVPDVEQLHRLAPLVQM
jgi:F420-dependent oxidoreductase-like protein